MDENLNHRMLLDQAFMGALDSISRGDRPIGTVIVHDNKIIVRASDMTNSKRDSMAHSVMLAVSSISKFLTGFGSECTVYTTQHPCPLCLAAIEHFKIPSLVTGTLPESMRISKEPAKVKSLLNVISDKHNEVLINKYKDAFENDGLPIPYNYLMHAVVAHYSIPNFIEGGKRVSNEIKGIINKNNFSINNFSNILDFGCGCGRVIRHWKEHSNANLYGTDYNPELIGWCNAKLDFADFRVNQLEPPLNFESGKFDLIYLFSVLTHLTEKVCFDWMREFHRLLRPGGIIVFTTHGDGHTKDLSSEQLEIYKSKGFLVNDSDVEGTNTCASFHTEKYVRENYCSGFNFIDYKPLALPQDIYLLQKKSI